MAAQLGTELLPLTNYCWLPDYKRIPFRVPEQDFYADDYLLFPGVTKHYDHICPEVEKTYEPYFRRALQALRHLRVSPQLFWRNNEETPPQTIATRTNERVREQSPHAVAEHDDVVGRKIGILRIDNLNRPLKLLAQPERVEQDRCAGTIIEVPELEPPRDLGIAFQAFTNCKNVNGVVCRPCTSKIGILFGSMAG